MNGVQRRIALGSLAVFLTIVALILVANAESSISDLGVAGAHVRDDLVWSWEWTSMIAWLSVCPAIWIAVARLRPPCVSWRWVGVALVLGSVVVSGWHIAVMVALRHVYYDAVGQGPYRFFTIPNRLIYEYRKDIATYLQFTGLAAVVQWLIARAVTVPAEPPRTLAVGDGAITHLIPVDEIESVAAAGNYVELAWLGRTLLHRATLAAVADELGEAFVRIHRGRLVRRAAIRRVETDKSGDFTVELASGAHLRGSRRYRAGIDASGSV